MSKYHSSQVRKGDPVKGRRGVTPNKACKFHVRSDYDQSLWAPPGQATSHRTKQRHNSEGEK
jgi:hypothetical protein